MAKLAEEASLETQMDYCVQVAAGLRSLDELEALAVAFEDLIKELQGKRDRRDAARWKVIGKSARVRVFDARWDGCVKQVSSQAFLLANKDAKQDPYNALFGTVTAEDATALGPSKAEAFGNTLLSKGAALGNAILNPLLAAVKTVQALLMTADKERDDATTEALTHEVERRKMLKQVEAAADQAEVGILTRFPGNRALVNAILVVKRPARKKQDAPEG